MSSQDDITCKNCGELYTDIHHKWCKPCLINGLKQNFVNWTSGNEEIDNFIQITQLKIDNLEDTIVEWIPYDQFDNIKEIGKGEFATVYLAKWKDGPLLYQYERIPYKEVALKCLHNSQNITNEFLNEVNAYSIGINNNILRIYGISQNPDTNNYIIVLEYANGGNLNNYNNNIIRNYNWISKLSVLSGIVQGLNKIHEKRLVHRDFHTGNILVSFRDNATGDAESDIYISDMRLCGEVSNIGKTKIYGVMPFVAPEVLRGEPYNQAADVYSFGMVMYHIATGRQPFSNCAHDSILALNICNGNRPEINEQEAPKFYIDLMKNCWDPDPYKRPSVIEIKKLVKDSLRDDDDEIKKQIEEAEEYRKTNFLSTGISQSIHPQAYYTSRLLNQFTKELSKHDDTYNISAEIIDFTE
ncbi:kinase-like domain-containing protein [Rhizophagus irregularis DAOM 181602=DAOM 197198]|nr:kinase-like domain-containing protein [Rhizophagus irregularis DAOM 181602=DAOM 197198]